MKFAVIGLGLLSAGLLSAQGGGMGNVGGFGGPSILGRGGQGGKRSGDGTRIRAYGGAQAMYDTGLTSVVPGPNGEIFTKGAGGVELDGGVYGMKAWRRNQLALNYAGNYRHYANLSQWNGSDQSVGLTYGTILTKRVSFEGNLTAGTTNRSFGMLVPTATDAIFQPGLPVNLFDIRTNYATGNGAVIYNRSPRTSFSFSGGGYIVKRNNAALVSVVGTQARADAVRRLNRRTSIGIDYTFMTFQFSRSFGDSYIHGLSVFVARQIGRSWELNIGGGAMNVETLGTRQVQIDPAIAAIIGVSTGVEVFYRNVILGSGVASLTRNSRSAHFGVNVSRTVNPGNGIILTSQADTASVTYGRRLSRTLNFDSSYTFSRLRGIGVIGGNFTTHNAGLGLGWQVARYAQLTARYDRRNSQTSALSTYNLNGNRFALGVMFTPSDIPISLW